QPGPVAGGGRRRESGEFGERQRPGVRESVGECPKSRSEHDSDRRLRFWQAEPLPRDAGAVEGQLGPRGHRALLYHAHRKASDIPRVKQGPMHELLEMLKTGGAVMVVTKLIILAGSIGAVIIGIERALFLRGFSAKARELHEQIVRALLRGEASIALHETDRSHIATVALYRAAFDRANRQDRIADAV